ncbi:MAG: hypothetical protein KF777_11865 [Planctomycetaceae bacterium]|nr:hypothetical protein [Planctomycetaceae bacterium]
MPGLVDPRNSGRSRWYNNWPAVIHAVGLFGVVAILAWALQPGESPQVIEASAFTEADAISRLLQRFGTDIARARVRYTGSTAAVMTDTSMKYGLGRTPSSGFFEFTGEAEYWPSKPCWTCQIAERKMPGRLCVPFRSPRGDMLFVILYDARIEFNQVDSRQTINRDGASIDDILGQFSGFACENVTTDQGKGQMVRSIISGLVQ